MQYVVHVYMLARVGHNLCKGDFFKATMNFSEAKYERHVTISVPISAAFVVPSYDRTCVFMIL